MEPMNAGEIFKTANISYSRLSSYDKCPRKFKLVYVDGNVAPSGRAAQVGKLVHEVLADYMREKTALGGVHKPDFGDILSRLPKVSGQLIGEKEITQEITAGDIDVFVRGFCTLYPEIDASQVAGIEEEKLFDINGYKVKGILDLVLRDAEGNLEIIDYKTGRPGYVDDLQLIMYSMPYFNDGPHQAINATFAFLKEPSLKKVRINRSMSNNTRDVVMGKVQEIETDEQFERRRGPLCNYCEVRHLCDGDRN
jgi:putative RecB family exonuclease